MRMEWPGFLGGLAFGPPNHRSNRAYGRVWNPGRIESASIGKRPLRCARPLQALVLCEERLIRVGTLANVVMLLDVCGRGRAHRFKLVPIRVERRDGLGEGCAIPN